MFFVYNTLLLLITVLLSPLLAAVLLLRKKYRCGFLEKCGLMFREGTATLARRPVWIHAVSVGEVMAAVPLIREMKRRFPDLPIVLSTVTETGNFTARANARAADAIIYFPYDYPFIVRRVVGRLRPRVFLTLETEIWPNLLRAMQRRGIPALIVSGRISRKSFKSYYAFRFFFRRVLRAVDHFCMQSSVDAERIMQIGAAQDNVSVCGNIKFDQQVPAVTPEEKSELYRQLALVPEQPVLIAGSTHRGEEQQVLEAFAEMRKTVPALVLLLAPRHPERFEEVAELLSQQKFKFVRRTALRQGAHREGHEVILLDTIGELARIYSIGTIIFIGGSLIGGVGGHNPLEPAVSSKPVLFGPHMSNFAEIAGILTDTQAAMQVASREAFVRQSLELLADPAKRTAIGGTAFRVIEENSGAVRKILDTVQGVLEKQA